MIYIVGAGGFAREVYSQFYNQLKGYPVKFLVEDQYYQPDMKVKIGSHGFDILGIQSTIDSLTNRVKIHGVVCIGDPSARHRLVERTFGDKMWYKTMINDESYIGLSNSIGEGTIICNGVQITTNVTIGKHCIFNLNSTVGHDSFIDDFVTVSPGANISGNCKIGKRVYIGTNATIREGVSICSDVTIGMGSVVLNDITEPGTYVGVPVKKIK